MTIEVMKQALEALKAARRGHCDHAWADEAMSDLSTAIEQAKKQEPYGYVSIGDQPVFRKETPEIGRWETVYTTPPAQPAQRQPLTEEQIELGRRVLSCFDLDLFMAGARFAEAAHGIKEKNHD
jgi:hypothetical protein